MAFPLPVCPSALALDIDGTITTADQRLVLWLVQAAREAGSHVAINTARPQAYCDNPDALTTRLTAREHHYCGFATALYSVLVADIPQAKVANMDTIAEVSGVRRGCALLVDDRPENIAAVRRAGYAGFLVNERTGITQPAAQSIMKHLRECRRAADEWSSARKSS
jgi:beta-phosphoglucomutase-like phosphatase (HAD superfamily)